MKQTVAGVGSCTGPAARNCCPPPQMRVGQASTSEGPPQRNDCVIRGQNGEGTGQRQGSQV